MRRDIAIAGLAMLLLAGTQVASVGIDTAARRNSLAAGSEPIQVSERGLLRNPALPRARLATGFELNIGQFDRHTEVAARQGALTLSLSGGDARLGSADRSEVVSVRLAGRSGRPLVEPLDRQRTTVNYFRGADSRLWRTNIPTYSRVRYRSVYPGIDLVYYFDPNGRLEHDFVVAPGASPAGIRLRIDGASSMALDHGDLRLHVGRRTITLRRPLIYQARGDLRHPIAGGYVMKGAREVAFELGEYDHEQTLWIDPVIDYSTYLGGPLGDFASGTDDARDVAVDAAGNAFVTGIAASRGFPTVNAWQPQFGGGWEDAFVAKFNPAGVLEYCTFLGGQGSDEGHGIAVGPTGVYVVGTTFTGSGIIGFPTTPGAFQTTGQSNDVFVARLDEAGTLAASTLLGGAGSDEGAAVAVDGVGNAYVTGTTSSANFPVAGAVQPAPGGWNDAFAAKLNAGLTALEYSTFVGGSRTDSGSDVAVDAAGNLVVTGTTDSSDFPTVNALSTSRAGASDAFVTKLNATGSSLVFSTYFGGALPVSVGGDERGTTLAIDSAGDIVFGGSTNSTDLPGTAGASAIGGPPHPINGGFENDAFIAKLTAAGTLVFATYVGGNGFDGVDGIGFDAAGLIYAAGHSQSRNLPASDSALADVGVYSSEDGGGTWTARRGGLGSPAVTALVLDPSSPDTLYAGTDRDGVFKSTNGGATWSSSSVGLGSPFISALVINPMATSTLYAATYGARVYKSVNGGASWTFSSSGIPIPYGISLAIAPSNPSTLYVGTAMRGGWGVFRTRDGGSTWTLAGPHWAYALAVDPSSSDRVYATHSSSLYKSETGGSPWTQVFVSAPYYDALTAVAIDPTAPTVVYVGTEGSGVFKSTDAGATWTRTSTGLPYYAFITAFAIDPANPAIVYAGTADRGVYKSSNGGVSWGPASTGIADTYVSQIALDAFGTSKLHAGIDGLYGDAFVAVFSADGALLSSTYVGGSRRDHGLGIAVTRAGTVNVVGSTRSHDWPTTANAVQPAYGGGYSDGFAMRLQCVAPVVTLSPVHVAPAVLWPPDHRMVPVSVDYEVLGACGPVTCSVHATSDEPPDLTGDGSTEPDWQPIDASHVSLRAERSGNRTGRTYSVTVTCTDETGRVGTSGAKVMVPLIAQQ